MKTRKEYLINQANSYLKSLSIDRYLESSSHLFNSDVTNLMKFFLEHNFYIVENPLVPPFENTPTLKDLDTITIKLNKYFFKEEITLYQNDRYANHILDVLINIRKIKSEKALNTCFKAISSNDFDYKQYLYCFTVANQYMDIGDQLPLNIMLEAQKAIYAKKILLKPETSTKDINYLI